MDEDMTRTSIFFFSLILFFSCTINEPQLPKWETNWEVHLNSDTFNLKEFLDKNSLFSDSSANNNYYINIADSTEPKTVGSDQLSYHVNAQSFSNTLGTFSITKPEPQISQGSNFAEIFADYNPQVGTPFPKLNPTTLHPEPRFISFEDFKSIEIEQASVSVVFNNNLIIGIAEGMQIVLRDSALSHTPSAGVIDTIDFNVAIPPNSSGESEAISLAGKTISNLLILEYIIPLMGTDEAKILTQKDLDGDFSTRVNMSDITVHRAQAMVPSQNITKTSSAVLNTDGHAIRNAKIKSGAIELEMSNNLALASNGTIKLLNFKNSSGQVLQKEITLQANTTQNFTIPLNSYHFAHAKLNGAFVDSLVYSFQLTTQASNQHIVVDEEDNVDVTAKIGSLEFENLNGLIEPIRFDIEPITKRDLFEAPNIEGAFVMPDLVLALNLHNQIDFNLDMHLNITGYKRDETNGVIVDSVKISLIETLQRGQNATQTRKIVLDKSSSAPSIVDLMALLPDEIKIDGYGEISGEGSVESNDQVWVDYNISSPLSLQINTPITYSAETEMLSEADFSAEERKKISDNFVETELEVALMNGLPIDGTVKVYISLDSTNLYNEEIADSSSKAILSFIFEKGKIGSDGFVKDGKKVTTSALFNRENMAIFNTVPIYYGYKLELNETDSKVKFSPQDIIEYSPVLKFKVDIDPESL